MLRSIQLHVHFTGIHNVKFTRNCGNYELIVFKKIKSIAFRIMLTHSY